MRPEQQPTRWAPADRPRQWAVAAVVVWLVVLLAISVRLQIVAPTRHNLYPTFALAARHWAADEPLYRVVDDRTQPDVYRYSPAVAPCFVPLTLLPDRLGSVVWRLVNAAVFLGALGAWLRATAPAVFRRHAGLVFLLVMPLAVGSLNNGQSNPLVTGLLLAAVAATARGGWKGAAACLAGAVLFKVYPISLALLLVLVLPRGFARALGVALVLGTVCPFLLQHPTYVADQYRAWFGYIQADDRSEFPVLIASRDLRLLFRVWLWPLSSSAYLGIQLAAAAAAAGLCAAGRRFGLPAPRLLNLALALAAVWMTVFGLAAESSTYILLAPSLVLLLVEVWASDAPEPASGGLALSGFLPTRWRGPRRPTIVRALSLLSFALLTATQVANWYAPLRTSFHVLGPHPLAGLLFLVALLVHERGRFGPEPTRRLCRVVGGGMARLPGTGGGRR